MIYTVAFAAGLAAKERAYVNVDVFINLIKGRPRAVLQLFIDLSVIALVAVMTWYGWKNAAVGFIQTSASLGIPMNYIYGAIVLHSGSILLYMTGLVFEDIKAIVTGEVNYGNVTFS
jgi:TRAP-type C4-dicarboxylate transport system permease small subunit